ncbi:sulfatase [Streptomyces sp. V4-01]|uniref:Sulfatase n=1 Tax=Actinacidiphila polyblastidii TaxID=3110430 RepID=A0ABU7P978_9ACTN|nr:sulfatase [Streptomyces sp. V4-01]
MSSNDQPGFGRRGFLAGAAAVTAATVTGIAAAGPAAAQSAAGSRPNILVILTDDQPNATEWATPKTLGWLVDNGVKFTHGHVSTPLCAPSRSSIFSGRYAHNHGVRDNSSPYNLDQHTTVQRYLHDAGYRTGLFGKYLNAWRSADNPAHFDDWLLLDPVVYNNGTYNDNGTVHGIAGYSTTVIKNRTLAFIDAAATDHRPWFAFVAPKAPHGPNTPDAKYANTPVPAWNGRPSVPEADRSDKPAYIQNATHTLDDGRTIRQNQLRTLLSVDDAVQEIHDKLAALGQLENTLVFYLGDNGYCWGDHGWTAKSVPYRPSIEVPFYVSWPAAGLSGGKVDNRIVANIDIAPTILDAAGITPDTPQNGHSLLGSNRRDHLLVEWWHRNPGSDPHTWASTVSASRQYTEYYALHTDSTGQEVGTGELVAREYYDLVNDPYQLTNLLYQATPAQEAALGIPALAAQLAADRAS